MKRWCLGRAGTVYNIVGSEDADPPLPEQPKDDVFEDPTGSTSVGAAYDPKDVTLDKVPQALAELCFHIWKGDLPGGPAPNASLTKAQFRSYVKSLMP